MAKKEMVEKIRAARHLKVRIEKLNKELGEYKSAIIGMMSVGETVIVDDCKTSLYESVRKTLDSKALAKWLAEKGLEIPEEFYTTTVSQSLRV